MAKIRRTLRTWSSLAHTWIGLTAGLLFCVLTLSGAMIVFRPQIEEAWGPKPLRPATCAAPGDADEAVRIVHAYDPGSHLERIAFPQDAQGVWRFQIARPNVAGPAVVRLAYDVCEQKVRGVANIPWLDWMVDLHHNMLAGKTGRRVVGAIGIALLLMSLSGLTVWLVSNPRWRTALKINTKASFHRLVFDAHRSVGLAATVVILAQSTTGIWLSYPKTLRESMGWFVPVDSPLKVLKPAKKTAKKKVAREDAEARISALISAASAALPDAKLAELRMPTEGGKAVEARMWRAGDVRSAGNNLVLLNSASAAVISVERFADQTPAQKLIDSVTPIHYGEWGGIGARILLAAIGIAPSILLVSGFLIWWLPKRARARKAAPVPSAEPVALLR